MVFAAATGHASPCPARGGRVKYTALGQVAGGRFKMADRAAFDAAFATWPDGPAWATFESAMVFRSALQNKYWHAAIVGPLAQHCGVSPRAMHDALKILLLPEAVVLRRADASVIKTITIGGSTAKLTRREAANLLDRAGALMRAIPLDLARDAANETHFIPYDAPPLGRGDARALCGALTNVRRHDVEPTCRECMAKLADESTP
jgi:hypothetical protein